MTLDWDTMFPDGSKRAQRAEGIGATYITLDMTGEEHLIEPDRIVKVYAMNPRQPACPINKDRAMLYREVESVLHARQVAQEWENGFVDALANVLESKGESK